jgi:hypothetical protein
MDAVRALLPDWAMLSLQDGRRKRAGTARRARRARKAGRWERCSLAMDMLKAS